MPGKSQVSLQSFNFTGARAGTNKRIGCFDDRNGIFFMQSGDGSLHFSLRSSVSGYTYDETVSQNNWNSLDKYESNSFLCMYYFFILNTKVRNIII